MSSNKIFLFFIPILVTALVVAGTLSVQSRDKEMNVEEHQSGKEIKIEAKNLFRFPGDWDMIESTSITAFYPGQTSWQWLVSREHAGAAGVGDMRCSNCHQPGELGEELIEPGPREPDPIPGKQPVKDVQVKAAYDNEYFYIRFQWASDRPGQTHDLWRFDGHEWQRYGAQRPEADRENILPSYEDRLAVIIDDQNLKASDACQASFSKSGCFITCHNSMRQMSHEPSSEQVRKHPYLGREGLDREDVRKYLLITRTEQNEAGAWDKLKNREELDNLFNQGKFLDLWQWRAARSNPVGYAGDDFVFEYRKSDDGMQPFKTPDEPEWMYDQSITGFKAIPESRFEEHIRDFPLIIGETAVKFDPEVDFQKGDILSRRVLRKPEGSAGDVTANGSYANGVWTVELRRKLDTGNPDDKILVPGKTYNIGTGLFDDHTSNRRHYVSFVKTLGIGVDADIRACSIK